MRFLNSSWCPICLGIIITILFLSSLFASSAPENLLISSRHAYNENEEWYAPSEELIPVNADGDLIRYGKELIVNTSKYLGFKGIVASISNGMNCQNCHLDAGTRNFANPFSAVTSTYPKYRDRSGRVESIEFRINECMQRSLNGKVLDSTSDEMKAMKAYIKWVGQGVPKDVKPKGSGTEELQFLNRAADPVKGKIVYVSKCQRCHADGNGVFNADSSAYTYPPLWGNNSFNVSAGMVRLSRLAGFIKNNMPFDSAKQKPVLTNEEAWDVAAFVASQQRPQKMFAYDWPKIETKPVDFPLGPYADNFSELQHKYGPFDVMKKR